MVRVVIRSGGSREMEWPVGIGGLILLPGEERSLTGCRPDRHALLPWWNSTGIRRITSRLRRNGGVSFEEIALLPGAGILWKVTDHRSPAKGVKARNSLPGADSRVDSPIRRGWPRPGTEVRAPWRGRGRLTPQPSSASNWSLRQPCEGLWRIVRVAGEAAVVIVVAHGFRSTGCEAGGRAP